MNPKLLRYEPQFGNQHPLSRMRDQIIGHRSAVVTETFLTTNNAYVTLSDSHPFMLTLNFHWSHLGYATKSVDWDVTSASTEYF
jgi:hypothetical protein